MSESTQPIERAYRLRAYPTPAQSALLAQLGGATRHVWNWALARRSTAWRESGERLNWVALSREFTAYRADPARPWLAALPRDPFEQVLRDLERAYAGFFAQRAKHPRFKRKGREVSMRFTLDQRRQQVADGGGRWATVQLPGLGRLRLRRSEPLIGRLRAVTLRRDSAGRWHAAITADGVPRAEAAPAQDAAVGLDAGLRAWVAAGDRGVVRLPNAQALAGAQARLRRYQRRMARQTAAQMRAQGLDPAQPLPKGTRLGRSNRRRRQQARIGRLHARIADLRREQLHQVSTAVVRSAQVIAIEDLAVKAMMRGMGRRAFRRSVADAGMGEMRRQLAYKAGWAGRQLVVVDRWYPSSKTCSACGAVHAGLTLRERTWTCPACGAAHDRDANAAINLRAEALRIVAASSPATPRSGESDARGESGAVGAVGGAPAPSRSPQHRRSMNREPTDASRGPNAARQTARARSRKPRRERGAAGSG
jgi:putative transposase